MNKEIEQWLNGGRDYDEGVALFVKYGGNRAQARVFQNTAARFAIKSLTYELTKLAKKTTSAPVAGKKPVAKAAAKDDNPVGRRAKDIIHEEWVKMSKKQEELYQTGTSNDADSLAKRQAIMAERDPHVARYNEVYEAKEEFYAGKKSEAELQQVIDGTAKAPKVVEQKSADVTIGDAALIKRLHALKTNITRSQNRLDYQQEKKGKEKNPMPACPKRSEIEAKLKAMQKEYADLTAERERRGL